MILCGVIFIACSTAIASFLAPHLDHNADHLRAKIRSQLNPNDPMLRHSFFNIKGAYFKFKIIGEDIQAPARGDRIRCDFFFV